LGVTGAGDDGVRRDEAGEGGVEVAVEAGGGFDCCPV
jgi:hypothetical protein